LSFSDKEQITATAWPTPSSLPEEIKGKYNFFKVNHEDIATRVQGIYNTEFGTRKNQHLGLTLLALEHGVARNIAPAPQLDVEDGTFATSAEKLRVLES